MPTRKMHKKDRLKARISSLVYFISITKITFFIEEAYLTFTLNMNYIPYMEQVRESETIIQQRNIFFCSRKMFT